MKLNKNINWEVKEMIAESMIQPKSQQLKEQFDQAELKFKKQIATFLTTNDSIIPIDECEDYLIVVFDDFILENLNNVIYYFTRGRRKYLDCFNLPQTYSKVPKQLEITLFFVHISSR